MRTRLIAVSLSVALVAVACAGTSLTDEERTYCRSVTSEEIDAGAADLSIDLEPIWDDANTLYLDEFEKLGDFDAAAEIAYQYMEDQAEFMDICRFLYENQKPAGDTQ